MTTARFAEAYARRYGLAIVPLPPREKRPVANDWGANVITDPDAARAYYEDHPDANIGIALGPSRLCSLDIDDAEAFGLIAAEFGIDLPALIAQTPTIHGNGDRLIFRVPDGMDLGYHSLTWPTRDAPKRAATVFELRAATGGQQRQDVFPPSVHPDTGRPYTWTTRPNGAFPEPPAWLLAMWRDWDRIKPQLQAVCPWAAPVPKPAAAEPRPHTGESVIGAWIAAHPITAALERYGYVQRGRRWLSPHSQSGLPGVSLLDDDRAWIHHASDPLCSDESGRPVNSFDLFAHYDHAGDVRAATKQAAQILGIAPRPRVPAVTATQTTPQTAPETPPGVPAVVDYLTPMPVVNARGRAISCIENVIECARRLGVVVRYNVISKEEELLIPGQGFSVDNGANASLAWFVSEAAKMQLPLDRIPDYLCYLADQNQYNPVAEWITSRAWDGQDRLSALIGTIRAVDESDPGIAAMKRAFITRWMISAVAAAFRPSGVSAHGVLVLQGPQYLGKTRWFKRLAPEHLGVLKDGLLLRPDDRDSVMRCVSHWLVELGEIDATFRRADVAALKSFLTSDRDVLRRAYARKESTYARRTVFFASVNPTHYLHDESGNRRYWTVACEHIDHDHDIDMQQVWAQVYESLYQRGESWFLTPEEFAALNEHNADFQVADPIEDLITHGLRWDQPRDLWDWRTATDVLTDLGRKNCAKADVTRAGILIRGLNGNSSRRTAVARLLLVPSLR